jgi:hypothetical protein
MLAHIQCSALSAKKGSARIQRPASPGGSNPKTRIENFVSKRQGYLVACWQPNALRSLQPRHSLPEKQETRACAAVKEGRKQRWGGGGVSKGTKEERGENASPWREVTAARNCVRVVLYKEIYFNI